MFCTSWDLLCWATLLMFCTPWDLLCWATLLCSAPPGTCCVGPHCYVLHPLGHVVLGHTAYVLHPLGPVVLGHTAWMQHLFFLSREKLFAEPPPPPSLPRVVTMSCSTCRYGLERWHSYREVERSQTLRDAEIGFKRTSAVENTLAIAIAMLTL